VSDGKGSGTASHLAGSGKRLPLPDVERMKSINH
jgi:hypothetical protein